MNQKPGLSPELLKSICTLLGLAAAAVGAINGPLTWPAITTAIGTALIMWMRSAPGDVNLQKLLESLPEEVRTTVHDSVKPPPEPEANGKQP